MSNKGISGLSIIVDRYATAMMELADRSNLHDNINRDLYLLKDLVKSNNELAALIDHPLISSEDKKDVLEKILSGEIAEYVLNLVRVLADSNRLLIMPLIADRYNAILCKKRNIDTAEVITAIPIDEGTLHRVKEKLEKLFQKQVNIKSRVDKSILAGMVIKISDKIIDGSIKTKFENMKKQLVQS
jgi:F-type H+-transporting ATPase subunit delta